MVLARSMPLSSLTSIILFHLFKCMACGCDASSSSSATGYLLPAHIVQPDQPGIAEGLHTQLCLETYLETCLETCGARN